jgi:hypothetical protein
MHTPSALLCPTKTLSPSRVWQVSPLVNWEYSIMREKAICEALRKCDLKTRSGLVYAEGFIPAVDEARLTEVIESVRRKSPAAVCDVCPSHTASQQSDGLSD